MLTHALRYAALGWPVIPLTGKIPLTPNGSRDGCTTPSVITDWWAQYPHANIGLPTGYKFFVLDVDNEQSLEELEAKHGKLPDTLQQITGSGGKHYLWSLPTHTVIKNSASRIGPGVDIRGDGGYIVAAPSIHPNTRQAYVWDGLQEFENQPILEAPEWLLRLCIEPERVPLELPEVIEPGNRNEILFKQASNMRGAGMRESEILNALVATNTERVTPPLPTGELRQIAKSVMRYEPNDIRKKATVRKAINEHVQSVTTFAAPGERAFADPQWADRLDKNLQDVPHKHIRNVRVVLEYNPHWHGAFAWNAFSHQIIATRSLCGGLLEAGAVVQDHHVSLINTEIQERTDVKVGTELIHEGIGIVARCSAFHPVRDYLGALHHDGEGRVDNWLSTYLGVGMSGYSAAIGRRWLISAIARVMSPGCKADCCLILEGKQGTFKSTALAVLGGYWFTDSLASLGQDKDSLLQLRGKWIIEIGELSALSRGEVTAVKAFMSRASDNYRAPYARTSQDIPRECVFAGTTNQSMYLKDETGNRRFWPVECTKIDIAALVADRDQLWAEAYQMYQDGCTWHLDNVAAIRESEAHQAARVECDPWHDLIASWCEHEDAVTPEEILAGDTDGLGRPVRGICKRRDQWTNADIQRVSRTLRQLGWERKQRRINGKQKWFYVNPQCNQGVTSDVTSTGDRLTT